MNKEVIVVSGNIQRDLMKFRNNFKEYILKINTKGVVELKSGVILKFHSNTNLIGLRDWKSYGEIYNHFLNHQNKSLKQELNKYKSIVDEMKEENKALLTLVNWCKECDFGFDNFADNNVVNWEEFEEECEDMSYTESMIYYAKKYNKIKELEEGNSNV